MVKIDENMFQNDRQELWGRLIDVVEDWLEEKGITKEDIPNPDREDEDAAIIYGDDYDYLADRFANAVGISRDYPERDVNLNEVRAEQAAKDLISYVNSYSPRDDIFAKIICNEHRTLQQSVMRLFIAVVREMSKVGTDERNEASVELAKKIMDIADAYPLPFI